MLLNTVGDGVENFAIGAEQIVTAHARLARDARRHNANIGACDIFVFICAEDVAVKTFHGAGVRQIQRFPLRQPINDVEHDHVAEPLQQRQMSHRAADITGSDQCYFLPSHNPSIGMLAAANSCKKALSACYCILATIASPKPEQLTSFAPGIKRSKS
jgi:hypothetical protein